MQLTARQREFVRIAGMSPAIYATDRRSAALRYTDGSARGPTPSPPKRVQRQTPISAG